MFYIELFAVASSAVCFFVTSTFISSCYSREIRLQPHIIAKFRPQPFNCTPSDQKVAIAFCSAKNSRTSVTCYYERTIGLIQGENSDEITTEQKTELVSSFKSVLPRSLTTGYSWSDLVVNGIVKETASFQCPAFHSCKLYQVQGSCGSYKIGADQFEIEAEKSSLKVCNEYSNPGTGKNLASYLFGGGALTAVCPEKDQGLSSFHAKYNGGKIYKEKSVTYGYTCCKGLSEDCQKSLVPVEGLTVINGSWLTSSDHAEKVSVMCHNGSLLSSFQLKRSNSVFQYEYNCCKSRYHRQKSTCQQRKQTWSEYQGVFNSRLLYLKDMTCGSNKAMTGFNISADHLFFHKWNVTVDYECCKLPECIDPTSQRVKIGSCNVNESQTAICEIEYEVGITNDNGKRVDENTLSNVKEIFMAMSNETKYSGLNWQNASLSGFQPTKSISAYIVCNGKTKCDIYQETGICGNFTIKTESIQLLIDDDTLITMAPTTNKNTATPLSEVANDSSLTLIWLAIVAVVAFSTLFGLVWRRIRAKAKQKGQDRNVDTVVLLISRDNELLTDESHNFL